MEFLTHDIAYAYRDRARALSYNGMQDTGARRALRIELQKRCGLTELEAVNIINGFHIGDYCTKYLIKAGCPRKEPPRKELPKGKRRGRREIY